MAKTIKCSVQNALILVATMLLYSCAADLFPGNQPIPPETVSELVVRGASLGSTNPRHKPLPEDIGASIDPENLNMVYSGELNILVMPNEFIKNNRDSGRFLYGFSKHLGDEIYELLPNQMFAVNGVPMRTLIEMYIGQLLPGMESLADIADFILDGSSFILPKNATHLELHFVSDDNPDAEPVFIERWELFGFYGYDRYLVPEIESMNQ